MRDVTTDISPDSPRCPHGTRLDRYCRSCDPDALTVGEPEALDALRLEAAMLSVASGHFAAHGWQYMAWLARATAAEYPVVAQRALDAAGMHGGWEPSSTRPLRVAAGWLPVAAVLGFTLGMAVAAVAR